MNEFRGTVHVTISMPNLQTIWTFPYQHQLLTIRGRLEAEGIETFTQDELTIQVDPLYSNALGGSKLMVQARDVERATEILAEEGFIKKPEKTGPEFVQLLYQFTGQLPLVGHLKFETRLLILIPVSILLIAGILYFLVK